MSGAWSGLPAVSVLMQNYNHGKYLAKAIQAHLQQTVRPLEIIVVDDCSTDDSRVVIENIALHHTCVRPIYHSVNRGVVSAMNTGLAEAKGEYVCFSAADDLVAPEFLARSLEILTKHPEAGFCFSDPAELLGDTGSTRAFPLFLSERPCYFSPQDFERLLAYNFFSFSSNAVVYRRDILVQTGGFREDLRWYTDWFLNFVLAFRHGACYVPRVLSFFRVLNNSYSTQGRRQSTTQRELLYRVLDLLETSEYRDVAPCFRRAGIVTDMRTRSLLWLLASPQHRSYLTLRLCLRLLFSGLWTVARPSTPVWLRQLARWLIGTPTRRIVACRRATTPQGRA